MSEPYYSDESVTLWLGDADGTLGQEAVLPSLGLAAVDAFLTDPPYNVSTRNGRDGTTVGTLKRKDGTARKVQRNFGDWDHTWDPKPFLAYVNDMLRDGGSLIAFTSEFLIGDYVTSGLNHRNLIYWRKTNPTPAFKKLYVRAVEMAVWQVKGKTGWVWNGGGYVPNVYEGKVVAGFACANGELREHPTQKPLWLMNRLITQHTNPGDLIVDPYSGSGSTLVAAKIAGRRAVGIEASEEYAEIAAKRLQESLALDFGEGA
jgi:DNA modification methylase